MNNKEKKKIQIVLDKFRKKKEAETPASSLDQNMDTGAGRDPQLRGFPTIEIFNKDGSLAKRVTGENHVSVFSNRFYNSRPLYLASATYNYNYYKNGMGQFDTRNNLRIYAMKEATAGPENRFGVGLPVGVNDISAWTTLDSEYSGEDMTRGTFNRIETKEGTFTSIAGSDDGYTLPLVRNTYVGDWAQDRGNGVIKELFIQYGDGGTSVKELLLPLSPSKFAYGGVIPALVPLGFTRGKALQTNSGENTLVCFGYNIALMNSVRDKFYLFRYANGTNPKNTRSFMVPLTGLENFMGSEYGVSTTGYNGTIGKPLIFNRSISMDIDVREVDISTDTSDFETFTTATGAIGSTYTLNMGGAPLVSEIDKLTNIHYTDDFIYALINRRNSEESHRFLILKFSKATKGFIDYMDTGNLFVYNDSGFPFTTPTPERCFILFNGNNVSEIKMASSHINPERDSVYNPMVFTAKYNQAGKWEGITRGNENVSRGFSTRQITNSSRALLAVNTVSRFMGTACPLVVEIEIPHYTALSHFILPEPIIKTVDQTMRITWNIDYYPNTLYSYTWDSLV